MNTKFDPTTVKESFNRPSQYSNKGRATRVHHKKPPRQAQVMPEFVVGKGGAFALKHKKHNTLFAFNCKVVHANLVLLNYSITSHKGPIEGTMCVVRRKNGTNCNLMSNYKEPSTHTAAFVADFHQMNTRDITATVGDSTPVNIHSRTVADLVIGLTLHSISL